MTHHRLPYPVAVVLLLAVMAHAQSPLDFSMPGGAEASEPVTVRAIWSADAVQQGGQIVLGVVFEMTGGYHVNAHEPGDPSLIPTTVETAGVPDGVIVGQPHYPEGKPFTIGEGEYAQHAIAYADRAVAYVPIAVAPEAEAGEHQLQVKVRYQACDDTQCLMPRDVRLTPMLTIVPRGQATEAMNVDDFAELNPAVFDDLSPGVSTVTFNAFGWRFDIGTSQIVLLLLVAALGGLLLNFTPCVLPVIPIKIIGLSQAAGNRGRCFALGLTMGIGVTAFWLALGAVIAGSIALAESTGESGTGITATNELFQYPLFTIVVGGIIAAMAVGMCGLFTIQLPQWVYRINPKHDSLPGSFGFGIMTAVLSTPCTAPFMGAAVAWAATRNPITTLTVFAAVGAGMAAPYVILSAFPRLVDRMPRTGPASELIKQVMGLLLLAAAAYFVGIGASSLFADPPQPPSLVYWWPVMAFIAAAGGWLIVRTLRITGRTGPRIVFTIVGVLFIAGGGYGAVTLTDRGPIDWVYYSPEKFEQAVANGEVVVLDFTAEWCLNCKTLEHGVLHRDEVVAALHSDGVTPMKVDITHGNEAGTAKLHAVGRLTIPLLVVYAPNGDEVFKSDAYGPRQVIDAIQIAKSSEGP